MGWDVLPRDCVITSSGQTLKECLIVCLSVTCILLSAQVSQVILTRYFNVLESTNMAELSVALKQFTSQAQITVFQKKKMPCSKSNGSIHMAMCLPSE